MIIFTIIYFFQLSIIFNVMMESGLNSILGNDNFHIILFKWFVYFSGVVSKINEIYGQL